MNRQTLVSFAPFALAAALTALVGGCASNSDNRMPEGRQAVESFGQTRAALDASQKQVDAVLASVAALSAGKDLPAARRSLDQSAADLRKSAAAARDRADAMQQRQAAFVKRWQQEMATIEDPALRSTLDQRREAVKANFAEVRAAGQQVADAYRAFDGRVAQLQKTLSIDLTPATVAGIRPALDGTTADGQALKAKITALQAELQRIADGLSPTGDPTAPAAKP